ncbi:tankyrase-1-like [Varroa jacobsoni]|uniref:tankyrase-1-like n=1 Tax=Varroa jacobsoni TaxID=62625 RepID=UPI000BF4F158|nr:tankyrase-1-like [Varroa jacobsoni]XP_022689907.1 tankyrase-1-like [Varroa jacobsoni]XP_022689908.1 tankyrase-1-like [Varroa jacobsoni]XP_022689909.1 tankyrase-1-like [Varroa jacobsoni]XP_022689910.1 tankyrase-1-like [Varroa jacobsoni]XP_022689911.1 tankyrase-1-like [Varroa jacobsoni]
MALAAGKSTACGIEVELASSALANRDSKAFAAVLQQAASPAYIVNSLTSSGQTVLGLAVSSGDVFLVRLCLEIPNGENVDNQPRTARSLPSSPATHRRINGKRLHSTGRVPSSASASEACGSAGVRQVDPPARHLTVASSPFLLRSPRGLDQFCSQLDTSSCYSASVEGRSRLRVDVNRHDFFDRAPLHYAAQLERLDILKLLIDNGAFVNSSDAVGLSPLHISVFRGRLENVKFLIKSGARLNAKSVEKQTPLHMAASYGYVEICAALLGAGAAMDALDSSERTPLMLAMQQNKNDSKRLETIRLLICHGANVNAKEIHGESPLVAAVWANDVELVALLLEAGARISPSDGLLQTAILHHNPTLVKALLPYIPLPLARNFVGDTPQLIAVREKQLDIFRSLVLHGADLTSRNIVGETLLHCLVRSLTEPFDLALFRRFLRLLAELNFSALNTETYVQGETPLFCAVITGKLKFAMLLVAFGCNPNAGHAFACKNIDVLRVARKKGSLDLVHLLVDAGYDLGPGLEPPPPPVPPELSPIEDFLSHASKNVLPLKKLARLSLRKQIKWPLQKSLAQLPLPQALRKYLVFAEHIDLY